MDWGELWACLGSAPPLFGKEGGERRRMRRGERRERDRE